MDPSDEPWMVRPAAAELRQEFKAAFLPSASVPSLSELTGRAVSKGGLGIADELDGGVLLRSVYWRIYLQTLPHDSLDSLSVTATALRQTREVYDVKRRKYLRAPDGRWAEDCTRPAAEAGEILGNGEPIEGGVGGDAWDPLSLGEENPWQEWFAAQDLRSTIMKDVERTFPDIPYFRSGTVRRALLTILFLWSIEHPDVGYRQGMHELAAVMLLVVDRDSIASPRAEERAMYSPLMDSADADSPDGAGGGANAVIDRVLDRACVEHDAYALFVQLMHAAKGWYEWRAESSPQAKRGAGAAQGKAKIVEMCNRLQQETIRRVDPVLGERMEAEGVEGQIWVIRYIRLLFTREMPLGAALRIWDGLFAVDPAMEHLVETVCVALILRIRNLLIPADYSTMLTALLRYPASSAELPLSPQLILSQALVLRDNPSPAGGAAVTLQNQEVLGIKALADERAEEEVERPRRQASRRGGAAVQGSPRIGAAGAGRPLEGLARGLMDRAQAAGLDKAILSTVSEFRKNLPEFTSPQASNFSFRTFSPPPSDFSSIPDMDAALPRPPPRSLRDADREIAELRLVMIGMGKAMNRWMIDVQPQEPAGEPAQAAWAGLGRLQHSLLDCGVVSTSDLARDWAWSNDLESRAATPSVPASADSMSGSVQSIASDTVLLNKPTSIQENGRAYAAAQGVTSRPHVHPPLTTSFASMMNGTSPRQFAFPSPFSSLGGSDAGRRASPIAPPERDRRASPNRPDLAARLAAATKSPDSIGVSRYPPTSPEMIEPLRGAAVRSVTTAKRKDVDPLLGTDL